MIVTWRIYEIRKNLLLNEPDGETSLTNELYEGGKVLSQISLGFGQISVSEMTVGSQGF